MAMVNNIPGIGGGGLDVEYKKSSNTDQESRCVAMEHRACHDAT
jgi:hypothetical protein